MKRAYLPLALTAALVITSCETVQAPADTAATEVQDIQTAQSAARPAPGHSKAGFVETHDIDGDGSVTLAEFMTEREKGYNHRDTNGDGAVHEDEYVSEYEVRLQQQLDAQRESQIKQAHVRFDVLDSDGDGVLTLDEFNASGSRMFSRLDTNGDGVVDAEDSAKGY